MNSFLDIRHQHFCCAQWSIHNNQAIYFIRYPNPLGCINKLNCEPLLINRNPCILNENYIEKRDGQDPQNHIWTVRDTWSPHQYTQCLYFFCNGPIFHFLIHIITLNSLNFSAASPLQYLWCLCIQSYNHFGSHKTYYKFSNIILPIINKHVIC